MARGCLFGSREPGSRKRWDDASLSHSIQHGLEPWPSMTGLLRTSKRNQQHFTYFLTPIHQPEFVTAVTLTEFKPLKAGTHHSTRHPP